MGKKKIVFLVLLLVLVGCVPKINDKKSSMLFHSPLIYNKYFSYSAHNKGIFQYGYYFPNIEGAIESVCGGLGNYLLIEPGEYRFHRTATITGTLNTLNGGYESKFVRKIGEESIIEVAINNIITGCSFYLEK